MNVYEPAVALVFSPENWVEDLHRHLSHHGGARVRQVVVEPSVALDEDYDVLIVSDRWPALTFGFVGAVHERGRRVLGVFDPDEPAGKDHLVALGVDATVAGDSEVSEFVTLLRSLGGTGYPELPDAMSATATQVETEAPTGTVVAVSGPRGSGITEITLGLAGALAVRRRSVLLIDGHASAPALAGRLGLGLEPNLHTAVDACAHGMGSLDDCVVPVGLPGARSLAVVAGHPSPIAASRVTTQDMLDVVTAGCAGHDFVVVDLDDGSSVARAVTRVADVAVGVVHASPVGVVRALEWAAAAHGRATTTRLRLVVNHAPRSRFRQEEIRSEIERTLSPASLDWCPYDRAVEVAAWDGTLVTRGSFHSGCVRLAAAIDPTVQPRRRRWSR